VAPNILATKTEQKFVVTFRVVQLRKEKYFSEIRPPKPSVKIYVRKISEVFHLTPWDGPLSDNIMTILSMKLLTDPQIKYVSIGRIFVRYASNHSNRHLT
jgi:hypothetical protein